MRFKFSQYYNIYLVRGAETIRKSSMTGLFLLNYILLLARNALPSKSASPQFISSRKHKSSYNCQQLQLPPNLQRQADAPQVLHANI